MRSITGLERSTNHGYSEDSTEEGSRPIGTPVRECPDEDVVSDLDSSLDVEKPGTPEHADDDAGPDISETQCG